jgi:polyvinyl alcohol dehydrogenase (cytochrome)
MTRDANLFRIALAIAPFLVTSPVWANPPTVESRATATAFGVQYDPAVGETLYTSHCATCHDHPTGRTPPKAVIAANPAFEIFYVLNNGVMRPNAAGLSGSERVSVAQYLSQNKNGDQTAQGRAGTEAPACAGKAPPLKLAATDWNGWGRDGDNTRNQPTPGLLAKDLPRLKLKWSMAVSGNRNGQPVVAGGRVFTDDSAGSVYSLDAKSGCAYWHFNAGGRTRNTVFLAPLTASKGRIAVFFTDSEGYLYALDADHGTLIWRTQVDVQPGHEFPGSVTVYDGVIYVPVSSAAEAFAGNDDYECCKFRGALIAVASAGKVLWTSYTTQAQARPFGKNRIGKQMYGPAGGAIWSAPTIDPKRGLVYVGTGDSYTDVPYDGAESIIAFSMKTGALVWKNLLTQSDNFIDGCYGPDDQRPANCPTTLGHDHDFGASPTLVKLASGKQIIVASQKSSQIYALDPDAQGKVIWEKRLSGGGPLGGRNSVTRWTPTIFTSESPTSIWKARRARN